MKPFQQKLLRKNLLLIDLEATCDDGGAVPRNEMEIIEIGAVELDNKIRVINEYDWFVKPVRHPTLTPFCTRLTSITQNQVDSAPSFPEVLALLNQKVDLSKVVFCSWGNYDRTQFEQDCEFHGVEYPFGPYHINVKVAVARFLGLRKPKGVGGMLRHFGLDFEGTPHRGIDDVKNITRILRASRMTFQDIVSYAGS